MSKLCYMKLHVDEESRIRNIQNEFNEVYPFLKIEFFKDSFTKNKRSQKAEKINSAERVKLIGPTKRASYNRYWKTKNSSTT